MLKFQEPSYISFFLFPLFKEVLIGDILEPLLFYIFFLLDGMGWNYSASYNLSSENNENKCKVFWCLL